MATVTHVENWRGSGTVIDNFKDFPDESNMVNVNDAPPASRNGRLSGYFII